MSTQPQSKRETAALARKNHILNAAIECFVEKGFHQTGMRDIAQHAHVSLGNLYNYFPAKHDMIIALAEMEMEEMEPFIQMLTQNAPVIERLKEFIYAYAVNASDPSAVRLYLEVLAEAMRQPDIAALFLESRNRIAKALKALIQEGIDTGVFEPSASDPNIPELILDLIEGASARSAMAQGDPNAQRASLEAFILRAIDVK